MGDGKGRHRPPLSVKDQAMSHHGTFALPAVQAHRSRKQPGPLLLLTSSLDISMERGLLVSPCVSFRPAAVECLLYQGLCGGDHGSLPG